MRVAPPFARVIFVVGDAVAVDAGYFRFGLVGGHAIFRGAALVGAFAVGVAEDLDEAGRVLQDVVGATPDDDARLLGDQFADDVALGHEQHVIRRKALLARRFVAVRQDALQPEGGDGLLVAADIGFVDTALLRCQVDELLVIELDAQFLGQHLAQQVSAAAKLAGDGDDRVRCLLGKNGRSRGCSPLVRYPIIKKAIVRRDEVHDGTYQQGGDHPPATSRRPA